MMAKFGSIYCHSFSGPRVSHTGTHLVSPGCYRVKWRPAARGGGKTSTSLEKRFRAVPFDPLAAGVLMP